MKRLSERLFRLKDLSSIIAESHDPDKKLKKVLGPFELILFGVGVIVGAGIFATVGTAAAGDALRPGAGPALILSFAITALACGFAALCYAEFASLVPISGSAYTYSYATFGELVAWIIGWDLMLEYCVGSIAVSISWAGYFNAFLHGFGFDLPAWLTIDYRSAFAGFQKAAALIANGTPIDQLTPGLQKAYAAIHTAPHIFGVPFICNAPASAIVLLLTVILVRGIKESSRFNIAIVTIKLLVLGFFVVLGSFYVKPENWVPFAPNGFAGIKAAAAIAFFAYIGFDCVSTVAEETRNPKRDMPIGIIGSLIICTIIYMLVAAVFTGIIPFDLLKTSLSHEKAEPLALAMQHINLPWAAIIVAFGSIAAQIAVLLVLQLGQSRIFFSMSRDGLLPQIFSRVHHRFKTPHVATIVTGIIIASVAAFTNIEEMIDLTNIGTLFAFVLVCFGVIVLRVKEPHRPRAFKVPLNPIIPLLGVASCIFLMTALPHITWIRFVVWLIIGLIVYFTYGMHNSILHQKHRAATHA
ncbi:MAG TPA: amino acid permease [Candidatus Omnitrophota bacterium]|nr:amino acid permease [Candidatus Omnitrophota bacterium]HPT07119.1 amino acid permease [Candidatus Omnitrophota bacterium]